jgi:Zn-dependent peptidase ImmA (M78 family)
MDLHRTRQGLRRPLHLLEHPFDSVILGEDHKRQFSEQQEKRATFMAGELLIPLAAAERMAFDGWDNARVAAAYGVSEQFAQMQMKGQRVRAQREQRKSTDFGFQPRELRAER